ncbi:UNVERIFIED_CONTAM: hypothetical protein GTU68_027481 [Idotea baltica]|nr:hypothetical protein [Idotea baltica]
MILLQGKEDSNGNQAPMYL